tara:strand:- start:7856 stop:9076 length:1221 start_codon:yes stop_codon:yes gene_type:complete
MKVAFVLPFSSSKDSVKVDEFELLKSRRWINQGLFLSKKGHEVIFIRYTDKPSYRRNHGSVKVYFTSVTIDFYRDSKKSWAGGGEFSLECLSILSEFNPDIIHSYNYLLPCYYPIFFFSKFKDKPLVAEHTGGHTTFAKLNNFFSFSNMLIFFRNFILRNTSKIMIQIKSEISNLNQIGVSNQKIISNISHIGIDPEIFRDINKEIACESTRLDPSNINLLFVGRIPPKLKSGKDFEGYKSPFILLDIIEKIQKYNKKYHVVIIGEGPGSQDLKNEILSRNLEKSVTSISWITSRTELANYYNSCDILYFPHPIENKFGIGGAANEAIACGLPTIVNSTSKDSYCDDFFYYVSPYSEIELIKGIEELVNNHDLRKKIHINYKKSTIQNLSWTIISKKLIKVYKKLL